MNPENLIRRHIFEMPAYEPILPFEVLTQRLGRPVNEIIKLDANENPYGPLPEVLQALGELPYTNIYPDPGSHAVRAALADTHGIPAENILAGSGADELIDLIFRLFIEPGDVIINCPPTFGMYQFDSDLNAGRAINVWRTPDFSLDVEGIRSAVHNYHPKLLFLASPNNPDGGLLPADILEEILALPLVVIVDEAYIEFAQPGSSQIQQVLQRENLVVLRTFSKWAGLAGLRVGYGVFPNVMMPHLWKIKQPYNLSVAAGTAAMTSLRHVNQLEAMGEKIIRERQRLFAMLSQFSWLKPFPSQANFILCRVEGREAARLKAQLADHGILVRYFNKPGLENNIRISIGRPEHSDALIAALKSLE